jgi:hypothetical protein
MMTVMTTMATAAMPPARVSRGRHEGQSQENQSDLGEQLHHILLSSEVDGHRP